MSLEKLVNKKFLKTYQMDRHGMLRPIMLMNELQAIADVHAELLNVGRTAALENNIAWVVTHYLIEIVEMPTDSEEIELSTWPSGRDGLRAIRDFQIKGADGRIMVNATSQWILIDVKTRRPVRLDAYWSYCDFIRQRAVAREFEKFPDFVADATAPVVPRFDDIDVNQHINNAVYAVWATEALGFEFRNGNKLRTLDINFKKEIKADEISGITIESKLGGTKSRHMIKTGDIEHANVVCGWGAI